MFRESCHGPCILYESTYETGLLPTVTVTRENGPRRVGSFERTQKPFTIPNPPVKLHNSITPCTYYNSGSVRLTRPFT